MINKIKTFFEMLVKKTDFLQSWSKGKTEQERAQMNNIIDEKDDVTISPVEISKYIEE